MDDLRSRTPQREADKGMGMPDVKFKFKDEVIELLSVDEPGVEGVRTYSMGQCEWAGRRNREGRTMYKNENESER